MFAALFLALWPGLLFGQAPGSCVDCREAGPVFQRRTAMSEKVQAPEFPERATTATTRPMTVPLDEFVLKPELYCHRRKGLSDDEATQKPLRDSLTVEGLLTPVEFFRDSDGKCVIVKGHRRIIAMRELAKRNTPGFSANMPVEAVEVVNATPKDLCALLVADNSNRNNFSVVERIRAAKTLYDGGVEVARRLRAELFHKSSTLRDSAHCQLRLDACPCRKR